MVAKIKAAVDARSDPDLLIVARTDAIATDGYEAAIERAGAYREAGADVSFVEAPQTLEQIAAIPRLLPWPQIVNIVLGGRTPELPNEKLRALGFAGVLYANVALQSALRGCRRRCRCCAGMDAWAIVPARGRFRGAPAAGRQGGVRRAGAEVQGRVVVARLATSPLLQFIQCVIKCSADGCCGGCRHSRRHPLIAQAALALMAGEAPLMACR